MILFLFHGCEGAAFCFRSLGAAIGVPSESIKDTCSSELPLPRFFISDEFVAPIDGIIRVGIMLFTAEKALDRLLDLGFSGLTFLVLLLVPSKETISCSAEATPRFLATVPPDPTGMAYER
jgi:hypothetical protein